MYSSNAKTVNRFYKFRIFPTEEQQKLIQKTFDCCSLVWNLMLEDKIHHYQMTKKKLSNTPAQYKTQYPELGAVDSLALANVQLNLEKAFNNFFTAPQHYRYPQFKEGRRKYTRYTTSRNNATNNIRIENGCIRLPKIGMVKIVLHRPLPEGWDFKSVTVMLTPEHTYYCSILMSKPVDDSPSVKIEKVLGMDYKCDGLYVDSEGNCPKMPHFFQDSCSQLKKLQQKIKNTRPRSANRKKLQKKYAQKCSHIAAQRKDFLDKLSCKLADEYDLICVEDLNMNHYLQKREYNISKNTADNAYGTFLNMLQYKLEDRGKHLIRVSQYYPSSQICSQCGKRNYDMRPRRPHAAYPQILRCSCGNVMDRDFNAAINIKEEGIRIYNTQYLAPGARGL